jgi:hypothetical protein
VTAARVFELLWRAIAACFVAAAALLAASTLWAMTQGYLPIAPTAALLIVLSAKPRRSAGPSLRLRPPALNPAAAIIQTLTASDWHVGRTERVLAQLTVAPLLCFCAALGLGRAVLRPELEGVSTWGLDSAFPTLIGLWALPLLAGPPLVAVLRGSAKRSRFQAVHTLAKLALGLAVLLTLAALLRATRHPSTLRASSAITRLHEVGELPPLRAELAGNPAPSEDGALDLLHDMDGVRVGRMCLRGGEGGWKCQLGIDDGTRSWLSLHHPPGGFPPPAPEEVVHVRRTRDGLVLVFEAGGLLRGGAKASGPPAGLTYRDLAEVLSPSPWAIGAAALGIAIAAHQLARRRDVAMRRAALLAGREGILRADGWIDFADDSAAERVETSLPPGPVVVIAVAARGPVYRSRAEIELVAGERASLLDQLDTELVERDAAAALAAVVASTPLAAAAWCGLVF